MKNNVKHISKKLLKEGKAFIASKKFVYIVLVLFIIQGIFFSIAIKEFTYADERWHFKVVKYYTQEQNLADGPLINNQSDSSTQELGYLEHKSAFLFHYLMSFPLRIVESVTGDYAAQAVFLRLINTMIGALCIVVFIKIGRLVTSDRAAVNLSALLLSFTGMFMWGSAAVNYDILAILFFFLFIYSLLEIINKKNYAFYIYGLIAMWASFLSKATFAPTLFVAAVLTLAISIRQDSLKNIVIAMKTYFQKTKRLIVLPTVAILTLLTIWVVLDPIISTLQYGSPEPSCDKVRSLQQCLRNEGLFKRNYEQKNVYQQQIRDGVAAAVYSPFSFTGNWIEAMYQSIYYYVGQQRMQMGQPTKILFFVAVLISVLAVLFRSTIFPRNKGIWLLFVITFTYITILYLFNLNTILGLGKAYAFQGRYLLPIIGFIYLGVVLSFTHNELIKKIGLPLKVFLIILFALILVRLNPFIIWSLNSDSSWYSIIYQKI